jgi:hypothetical protein
VFNPWTRLPAKVPYVLDADRGEIDKFNSRLTRDSRHWLQVEAVIPEPFVGNVRTAPVIVLQLNPGYDDNDSEWHSQPAFRAASIANLRHKKSEWPFFFFDPQFRASPGGKWWIGKTRAMAAEIGLSKLAKNLAIVEWFPYHSNRFKRGCRVASQVYGFSLVSAAIDRKAIIVVARGQKLWEESVPALRTYPRVLALSSVQNTAITPANLKLKGIKTDAAWKMLLSALE